ncbi:MAG: hypothetical protein HZB98_10635 [Bacteroidia bacterium]|nr:hypothetical protein [Bacteroidia bacterium]
MYLKRVLYLILILILAFQPANGQPSSSNVSVQLDNLFGRLLKVNDDSVRLQVNDSIKTIIDHYTDSDSIFRHRFDNLRFLGQIISPDSLIKIVTWNLFLRKQPGRYYCYLIKQQPELQKRKVYKRHAEYDSASINREISYSKDTWYGALYYDIRPQVINGTECWVLLGINYGNPDVARKIIEILSFGKDDSLIFGQHLPAMMTSDGSLRMLEAVLMIHRSTIFHLLFLSRILWHILKRGGITETAKLPSLVHMIQLNSLR